MPTSVLHIARLKPVPLHWLCWLLWVVVLLPQKLPMQN